MSILSGEFLVLIFISVVLYYITPKKYRKFILLLASYAFYIISSGILSFYLISSTISIYIGARLISKNNNQIKNISEEVSKEEKKVLRKQIKNKNKFIMLLIVLINLAILFILKYFDFFGASINTILNIFNSNISIKSFNFLLPLGISYYTLQAIGYLIDVYRDKHEAENSFFNMALFVSFFPQMTMGPIGRYNDLQESLTKGNDFELENIKNGTHRILFGIFKKMVIADRAAIFVNAVFATTTGGITIIVAGILYTIQIYAEFSGMMDMVVGVAKLYGVRLSENFQQPFSARTIQEFWQRWHITLGTWLKDYIFYPLSLSKMNMNLNLKAKKLFPNHFGKFITIAFPLLFVWFSNGLWHGASWKYILYGLYYYILMMLGVLLKPLTNKLLNKFKINIEKNYFFLFQISRTIIIVVVGMLLFRSPSIRDFGISISRIFTKASSNILDFGLTKIDFGIIIFSIIVLILVGLIEKNKTSLYMYLKQKNICIKYAFYLILIMLIIIFGIYGPGYNISDFIYGSF